MNLSEISIEEAEVTCVANVVDKFDFSKVDFEDDGKGNKSPIARYVEAVVDSNLPDSSKVMLLQSFISHLCYKHTDLTINLQVQKKLINSARGLLHRATCLINDILGVSVFRSNAYKEPIETKVKVLSGEVEYFFKSVEERR